MLRPLFCASFAVSLVLSWGLALGHVRAVAILEALLAAVVIAGWMAIPALERRKLPVAWLLSIAVLNGLLGVPELLLRIRDFRYSPGIQFGYPRPSAYVPFVADSVLFWTYDPADPDVNSWGFRERDILPGDKPAATIRVLFLGDSCVEQGYPRFVETLLDAEGTGRRFECLSLAIAGYSSFQGRRVAETHGALVDPDVVVVQYGWNDHWQAYGTADSEKRVRVRASGMADAWIARSRLVQFLQYIGLRGRESAPLGVPRVSLDEYRSNLAAIYRVFDAIGAEVVFLTSPSAHSTLGFPDYLLELQFAADEQSAVALHERYNEAVRGIQRESPRSALGDFEAEYGRMTPSELEATFLPDGIHFSDLGLIRLAHDVSGILRRLEGAALR